MSAETSSEKKLYETVSLSLACLNVHVNTLNHYIDKFKEVKKGSASAHLAESIRCFAAIAMQDMNSIDLCIKEDRLQKAKARLELGKKRAKEVKERREIKQRRKTFKLVQCQLTR